MNNRIKEIRNDLGLTLEKFGEKIGITKSSVSLIERGINNPSDQTIKLICSEFGVNEEWLRFGIGEKFSDTELNEEIARWAAKTLKGNNKEFKKRLINVLISLDENSWIILHDKLKEILVDKETD